MSSETLLLTVVLRHDQSQNLEELQGRLDDAGWWHGFPPEGCEVVSWVVAMGLGQVVTLRLPASLLAQVNVELERRAWGVFETDFYPTYDFVPVRERLTRESDARLSDASLSDADLADAGSSGVPS